MSRAAADLIVRGTAAVLRGGRTAAVDRCAAIRTLIAAFHAIDRLTASETAD